MGERSASPRFRKFLALALFACLFVSEAASLNWRELRERARALPRFARLSPEEARLHGSALAFDRPFGLFLQGVVRATPPTSTVALLAPASSDREDYAAQYILAPRRVVEIGSSREADVAAAYRRDLVPGFPAAVDVPFGRVGFRR